MINSLMEYLKKVPAQLRKIVDLKALKNNEKLSAFLSEGGKILSNTNIKSRLIVSFLSLSLIPLLITGAISYSQSKRSIETNIKTYSAELVKQL
ncbi:MAG: hypothetical protein N2489_07980, partial [Clostridia bacterium]|nr:hypothetical protein [Clostridia bacterium]